MKIYTRFDENRPGVMRLWVRSWQARGWTPRILVGTETSGKGLEVPCDWINFNLKNPRSKPKSFLRDWEYLGEINWRTFPLVAFPNAKTDEDILNCGRDLCL